VKLPPISRVAQAITFCAGVSALVMAWTGRGMAGELVVAGVVMVGFAVHDFIGESKQKRKQKTL
jgi:hypothetical protein